MTMRALIFAAILCLLIIFIVLNITGVPKNVQVRVFAFLGVACLFLDGVGVGLAYFFWKSDKKKGKTKLDFKDYLKIFSGGSEVIRR